ncbi:MAG: triple tyrosine motif-containing protein, partial [Bacteroidota bacterium]
MTRLAHTRLRPGGLLMLYWLLNITVVFGQVVVPPLDPEAGRPKAIDYPVGSFGADRESWAIDQAPNGLIYAANNGGLLEFDGVAWTTYRLPSNAPLRALDIGPDNSVYVGGENAMGYFSYTPKKGLQFTNLSDKLPVDQRDFSNIWEVVVSEEGVLFFSHAAIYVYDGKDIRIIRPKANTSFSEGFDYKDDLYVYDLTNGLQMVRNNQLVRVGWASRLRNAYICSMIPFGDDVLVGTRELGLMRYDGRQISPFETELPPYVEEKVLTNGLSLANGYLVFSTIGRGIYILTPEGKLVGQFDDQYGLQDDKVLDMFVDRQGSLWLAMNNGISMLDYPSPMTYFRDLEGLTGEVYDFIRHNGTLYAGTYKGIYYLDTTQTRARFKRLEGVASECYAFAAIEDQLYAATSQGVYELLGTRGAREIFEQSAKVLLVNEQRPDLMLVGNRMGLTILERRGGIWQGSARLSGITASITSMAADNEGTAWLTTENKGVLQIAHLYDDKDYSVRRLDTASGLPTLQDLKAFTMNGEVRIGSPRGLYRWEQRKQLFSTDQSRSVYLGNGKWGVSDLTLSPKGDLWVLPSSGDRLLFHNRLHDHRLNLQEIPVSMVANSPGALLSIYADREEAIWLGMRKGIIRYKNDWRTRLIKDTTRVVFRRIFLENGEQDLPPEPTENYEFSNYAASKIQIHFAAIGFKQPGTTRYQYMLDGRGKNEWSEFSTKPHIRFSNLPDGNYTLYVRAVTGEGYPTNVSSLNFTIQPPWFRSWWAIMLYLVF